MIAVLLVPLALGCIGVENAGPGNDAALVSGLSPAYYDTARLNVGDQYYLDRAYTISSLGPGLGNRLWIRTANDDKGSAQESFITFDLLAEAHVAIGYDRGAAAVPDWLDGWTEAPADVDVTLPAPASPLRLFHRQHAAGPVSLGGNLASGATGAQSMYVVLLLRTTEMGPAAIRVEPTDVVVDPGATVQFTATARDPLGRPVAAAGAIEWSATGGTISAQGLYTAGATPGGFEARAKSSGSALERTVAVTIREPGNSDTSAPVIGGGQPTGTLPAGTTQAVMSVTTNEGATCRWGTSATASYTELPNTFTTTGGTAHSTTLTGLADGQSYSYYVRCRDAAGNANDASYTISFSVASASSGAVITGVTFNWSTHRREAPGSDNWPITWSNDGHQYTSWGDGGGFGGTNSDGRVSLGFARVEGDPANYVGYNVWGGKNPEAPATFAGKSYGIISIGGTLYAWVSPNTNVDAYEKFTLYKSTDKSKTWQATNVVFTLASHNLIMPTILNFGQDYAGARDGYVYSYAADAKTTSALAVQAPGAIYLMRVPIAHIENQAAYEFYTSTDPNNPTWGTFANRKPVFVDPNGVSWNTGSVTHVPGLDRYVLVTEHTATFKGNIQMHEAPEPWGPWTQILRQSAWGNVQSTTFYWTFAPKWFRNGGVNFTLVFTGVSENDSWNTVEGSFTVSGGQ